MAGPPAYAPTAATLYTPALAGTNFHQEVTRQQLFPTLTHKAVYESLCEVYLILTVLEMVETAFVKDYITDKEQYTATVMRLINQYGILRQSFSKSPTHRMVLQEVLPGVHDDHDNLLALIQTKYRIDTPLAAERLLLGIPATIEHHEAPGERDRASLRLVAEATGNFITIMDAVKLSYKTKAQLHPLLSDLVVLLNELADTKDFTGKSRLVNWLIKLNNLELELDETEADQFLSDLDTAYKGFIESL